MGPLVPYFGGKNRLVKRIIERIKPHATYVEVFAGGAGVLFRKEPSKYEILNDLDRELVTLYRVVKNHPEEFCRQFKLVLFSRDEFKRLHDIPAATLTDVQRAARYFYLQRGAFGGKVVGQTFGVAVDRPPRVNILNMEQAIHDSWLRLGQVTIECLDFRGLLKRYDRRATFFFLDPPYWNIPGYRHDFKEQDFVDLADILYKVKGQFLMTINDTPEVREMFSKFNVEEVQLKYSLNQAADSRSKTRTELFISN